jgi:hypothetical protein
MKSAAVLFLFLACLSCTQPIDHTPALQQRLDSLEQKLAEAYKPGLGEFMSSIQVHHGKLWFAGLNRNWKLADFEVHEIMETIAGIQAWQQERKEVAQLGIISAPLDSVNQAIQKNDPALFKSSFMRLTATCNNCHRSVGFGFNVVKVPDTPPFSNQEFKNQE